MSDIGSRIKELRISKGLTLEYVANKVGVGKSTVRKWETGMIQNMKRDKIALLADALNTTPAYIMGWEETPTQTKNQPTDNDELNVTQKEIIDLVKAIPDDQLDMVIRFLRALLAE